MRKISIFMMILSFFFSDNLLADIPPALAPGYSPLDFKVPQAGSYDLPIIGKAGGGQVLTIANQERYLDKLMGDKITLLSFIYSTCSDINGCPLATQVFHKINRRLQKEPELADKLRLLTLSFNPEHDTPEAMKAYGASFSSDTVEWQFLTTQSEQQLQPILDQYQQAVQKIYDDQGEFTGTFSHILRVYLIDTEKQIRNIYSVSFLHADTLINDVKTLINEATLKKLVATPAELQTRQTGVHKNNYQTKSISLAERQGEATNLLHYIKAVPLGLPAIPIPIGQPITAEKIALGRKLFFDRRLSLNNTFSCAMCHIPEQGFSSQEMATAVGIEGRSVRRNSPTIYNVAYATLLFHDGRENKLDQQVWGPILAQNEMGNPSVGYVVDKIKALDDYQAQFAQIFNRGPGMSTIGEVLASYQRSLVSADSAFDRWYFAKQSDAVSEKVKRGFDLFKGKGACSQCHTIAKNFALFTDNKMHNTGIGYQASMQNTPDKQQIQVAPGVFIEVESKQITAVTETKPSDLGRYEITQDPQDRWKYKTPSLRNIALTAPYMHNGSLSTLSDVVDFYNQGGVNNKTLDPLIQPLHLSAEETHELVIFLQALTGSNVDQLVADAYAAPVGN